MPPGMAIHFSWANLIGFEKGQNACKLFGVLTFVQADMEQATGTP